MQAAYSESCARHQGYQAVKRPCIQSIFTEACERILTKRQLQFDKILESYFDALDAKVVVRDRLRAKETTVPDHSLRMEATNRIVSLYGGVPREVEMPPSPDKGMTVIIMRNGPPAEKPTIDVTPKTQIHPQGKGQPPHPKVKIVKDET